MVISRLPVARYAPQVRKQFRGETPYAGTLGVGRFRRWMGGGRLQNTVGQIVATFLHAPKMMMLGPTHDRIHRHCNSSEVRSERIGP